MIIAPVTSDNMNNFKDGGQVCAMLNKKKTSTNTLQQIGQLVGRSQQPAAEDNEQLREISIIYKHMFV